VSEVKNSGGKVGEGRDVFLLRGKREKQVDWRTDGGRTGGRGETVRNVKAGRDRRIGGGGDKRGLEHGKPQ